MKSRICIKFLVISVLAASLLVLNRPRRIEQFFEPHLPLSEFLPRLIADVPGTDLELGSNGFETARAIEILGATDFAYRRYITEFGPVDVLIVYWAADNSFALDSRGHVPDVCWIEAGFELMASNYEMKFPGSFNAHLLPAQYRDFRSPFRIDAAYWHLWGGRLSGDALGPSSRWSARFPHLLRKGKDWLVYGIQRETVLIRVSTKGAMVELSNTNWWRQLMIALAPMGVIDFGAEE